MIARLKEFISHSGLSTRAFALKCGLAQNTLSNQLNGMRELSLKSVYNIANAFPELSTDWLIRGEGEMLKVSPTLDIDRIATLVDTIATLQKTISEKDKSIAILAAQVEQLKNQLNK